MLNLPQLPTDNLYKFIALSGVAVFLLSLSALLYVPQSYFANLFTVLEEEGVLKAEEHALQKRIESFKDRVMTEEDRKALEETLIDIYKRNNAFAAKETALSYRKEVVRYTFIGASISLGIGFLAAFWGFRLWYSRVQVYQDRLLKKEAGNEEAKEISLDTEPKEKGS